MRQSGPRMTAYSHPLATLTEKYRLIELPADGFVLKSCHPCAHWLVTDLRGDVKKIAFVIWSDSQLSDTPLFTIFTPTYNRRHTIRRVYDSLCAQTLRDFEWLVIDDGSTDGTSELVKGWVESADFPIRYFWQENSGKHIAHNL